MSCPYPRLSRRYAYETGKCRCADCTAYNTERLKAYRRSKGMLSQQRLLEDGSISKSLYQVTDTGCWVWLGGINSNGYGRIHFNGQTWLAHRLSFFNANGYLTEVVMHICDNPPCVNPQHLQGGTQADNVADMWSKGRGNTTANVSGESHGMAKISWEEVRMMRRDWSNGLFTQVELAKKYGLGTSQVCNIVNNLQWIEERAKP